MNGLTLHQLRCFDAVISEGSFQAAADKLFRSQPTVFAAVKSLETQLGLRLLDRSGYRVEVTDAGRSVHQRVLGLLQEYAGLATHAAQLALGEEAELRVVIGDLCPLAPTLGLLRRFFDQCPATRLHLHFEAISGPWERLREGAADLVFHHDAAGASDVESIVTGTVALIPVVAPGFLRFAITPDITPEQMRDHVQCVIRDSAREPAPRDYYVLPGARSWTVSDQLMKREIIQQGMGWGHMPDFLVASDLEAGRLQALTGRHFPGGRVTLVAARRRTVAHGPVAQRLWRFIEEASSRKDAPVLE